MNVRNEDVVEYGVTKCKPLVNGPEPRVVNKWVTPRGTFKYQVCNTNDVLIYLKMYQTDEEQIKVMYLNNRHYVIDCRIESIGTINNSPANSRRIVSSCLELNAAAIIVTHNHPSGESRASACDIAVTARLKLVLDVIDVRLLDHIVISGERSYSMLEEGILEVNNLNKYLKF